VDQFGVTVYPSPYDFDCKLISLTTTPISDFSLNVKHLTGAVANDKTFIVTNSALAGCTNGLTWVLEFNDPSKGYTTNPYGTYFSIASTTGVLTY
jgi:hypothetical protein